MARSGDLISGMVRSTRLNRFLPLVELVAERLSQDLVRRPAPHLGMLFAVPSSLRTPMRSEPPDVFIDDEDLPTVLSWDAKTRAQNVEPFSAISFPASQLD